MQVFKKYTYFILVLYLLVSCSRLDRTAKVETLTDNISPQASRIRNARASLMLSKQSLKIGLLRLENLDNWPIRQFVIVEVGALVFNNKEFLGSHGGLHQQLLPEFYKILRLLNEKNRGAVFLCPGNGVCSFIKALSVGKSKRSQFIYLDKDKWLTAANYPLLYTIGESETLFQNLASQSAQSTWKNWQSKWLFVSSFSNGLIGEREWANVVPTVKEF